MRISDWSSDVCSSDLYDVDEHYIPALGIELSAGRNFSTDYGMDSLGAIINETAASAFGWTDGALGKTLVNGDKKQLRVIGVVKDFHFKSLHERITPLVMVLNSNFGHLIVKAKPGEITSLLETMKSEEHTTELQSIMRNTD